MGMKNGNWKKLYIDGKILGIVLYVNHKIHGKYITYYRNGNINSITNYVNRKKEGEDKFYRSNRILWSQKYFQNDRKVKNYTCFSRNSVVIYNCYSIL